MTTLKLAIFDCDGTLVDSQRSIIRAMVGGFEEHGVTAPCRAEILGVVGLPLRQCVAKLYPEGEPARIDAITASYSRLFREHRESGLDEPPLYPHTRETLQALAERGVLLAVATGKSRRGLTHTLAAHELTHLFIETRTADDGPGKPNPDIILDICACTGVSPKDAVMIGDTTFDIEMAVHAKMPALGVSWGYHAPARLADAGAFEVIHDWTEADAAFARQFGARDPSRVSSG